GFDSEPPWFEVSVAPGGICINCEPGLPGAQAIGGRADDIHLRLLAKLGADNMSLSAEELWSLLPHSLQRIWESESEVFTQAGVGGRWILTLVTETCTRRCTFSLGSESDKVDN